MSEADLHATHTVFNQPPPLEDYNVFASDRALVEALRREGAEWAEERARAFGGIAGRAETIAWGFQANENRPVLVRHASPAIADAFCATRLAGEGGRAFGTLPPGTDFEAILERAAPEGVESPCR